MAKGKLSFGAAETERVKLTKAQEAQIRKLYKDAAKKVAAEAEKAPRVPSDALRKQYLNILKAQLDDQIASIGKGLEESIKTNMLAEAQAVVNCNIDFLKSIGMPIQGAFSHVPADVVQSLVTGKIYDGDWSLSKSIWGGTAKTQKDIQSVIAQGVAMNKSAYDIAKDLEKYVDPTAKKDWEWSKVYPGTNRVVDYNAQRLARTMVSHAYQQSFINTTQKNPFVDAYKWLISNSHRTCEICIDRATTDQYNLGEGVFPKDALPMDHPNGMCTYEAVMTSNMNQIADRIADWANGKSDPALDGYAKYLYGSDKAASRAKQATKAPKPSSKPKFNLQQELSKSSKIGDLNKIINKSGWFTNKVYFQGLDVETAKHVISGYEKIFNRYPQLMNKFPSPKVMQLANPKVYAQCRTSTTGEITLNTSRFSLTWDKLSKMYLGDVSVGFHPEGTTAESLLIHEFGHAIDGYLGRTLNTADGYVSTDLIKTALKKSGTAEANLGWKVSVYAKKNYRECLAECFAEAMESPEPSNMSQAVLKELDALMKKVT